MDTGPNDNPPSKPEPESEPKPKPGTSRQAEEQDRNSEPELIEDDDDNVDADEDQEFYNVEEIRQSRINSDTGILEYLIKWENYPESANTWEPSDNLNCPEALKRFEATQREKERDKAKRRRNVARNSQAKTHSDGAHFKRAKRDTTTNGDDVDTRSARSDSSEVEADKQPAAETEATRPKGFDRGFELESIVGSCTDAKGRLWFFIKWKGQNELEMVESADVEEREPKLLCAWYRLRLYHSIKLPETSPAGARNVIKSPITIE